jgi:DNA-3-methyladenine glycosylase II
VPARASFQLVPRPPFRLDLTVWTLRRRPENRIDRWDGHTYRRVLVEEGTPFEIAVTQSGGPTKPRLHVHLTGDLAIETARAIAVPAIQRLLGIRIDLAAFYRFCETEEALRNLARQFRGVKPPRFASYFETLINAIACQQITLTAGIRLLNRLAEACGPAIETDEGVAYGLPGPAQLAQASIERLREMGFSYRKATYLTGLARVLVEDEFDLEEVASLEDDRALSQLCRLHGVGRWSAEYFLLRGLGRTHIFPGDDVGARNHLQRWLQRSGPMDYDQVQEALRHWRPYGGLLYFHLLLKSLEEKGVLGKCEKQTLLE